MGEWQFSRKVVKRKKNRYFMVRSI
jgi:hypothetical protein